LDVVVANYHETWNSREKYRKVLDTTSYIIIQIAPNGKIFFANKIVSILRFDVFGLIVQGFKDFCEDTLIDTSRTHILIRRVDRQATTNQKIPRKVNK
jgi:hypothetical protein